MLQALSSEQDIGFSSEVPAVFKRAFRDVDLDPTRRAVRRIAEEYRLHEPISLQTEEAPTLAGAFARPPAHRATPPLLVQVELQTITQKRFVFDYIELRLLSVKPDEFMWSNRHQPIDTELTISINPKTGEFNTRFKQKTVPRNAHEYLTALRLHACLSEPVALRIIERSTGIQIMHSDFATGLLPPPNPEIVAAVADLDAIQQKVQRPILIKAGQSVSPKDQEVIAKLRTILHEGGFTTTWTDFTPEVSLPGVREILEGFGDGQSNWFQVQEEGKETLFGVELPLGLVRHIFHAKLENEETVRAWVASAPGEDAVLEVRFVPADEDRVMRVDYLDWAPQSLVTITGESESNRAENESSANPDFGAPLPNALVEGLYKAAARIGIPPEALALAGVQYAANQPESVLHTLLQDQETSVMGTVSNTSAELSAQANQHHQALAALALQATPASPPRDAWRQMLGVFDNDPVMHEIFEAGQRIREAERAE